MNSKVKITCVQCGIEFMTWPSYAKDSKKFCSRICVNKSLTGKVPVAHARLMDMIQAGHRWTNRKRGQNKKCAVCDTVFYLPLSSVKTGTRKTCSLKCRSILRNGAPSKNVGRKATEETKRKQSEAHKRIGNKPPVQYGSQNCKWNGGTTKEAAKIRGSVEYKAWRVSVFERDNYTCVLCGQVGGQLNADHIQPFAFYPHLRFELSNGRTLCVPCHKNTDTYLSKAKLGRLNNLVLSEGAASGS